MQSCKKMNKIIICLHVLMALWSVTRAEDDTIEHYFEFDRDFFNKELKDVKDSHAATVTLVKESEEL